MRQDLPFKDNLSRGRHLQIDSLTFYQWNRRSLQRAGYFDFVDVRRKLHAAYDRDYRLPADCNRHGHGSVHRFVFLVHLTDMLLQRKKTTESVSIMDHQAIHAPVDPRAVRILGDYGVPSADVPPAITAVNQRDREFKNIDVVA
jgi:hypothetical protein